jgi:hypothetical protein
MSLGLHDGNHHLDLFNGVSHHHPVSRQAVCRGQDDIRLEEDT